MGYENLKEHLIDKLKAKKRATFTLYTSLTKSRMKLPDYEGSETFFLRNGTDRFLLAFFVRNEAWKKGEIYSENLDNLTMFYRNLLHFFHALNNELRIPFTLHDPRNHLSRFDLAELLDLDPRAQIALLENRIAQQEKIISCNFPLIRLSREMDFILRDF